MRILADTHTFLWWVLNDPQLSALAHTILGDGNNTIYLSSASTWEITIKAQTGKLPLPDTPEKFIPEQCVLNAFEILPITMEHTLQTYGLPLHHRDPFDRILVAQC